jgi:hypothetical protein
MVAWTNLPLPERLIIVGAGRCLLNSLDPADNRIFVHDHEAAIRAIIELFARDKAVANLARNSPHRPAQGPKDNHVLPLNDGIAVAQAIFGVKPTDFPLCYNAQ